MPPAAVSGSALRAMFDQPASASAAELGDGASRVDGAAPRSRAPSSNAAAPAARRARTDSGRRDTPTTRASRPPLGHDSKSAEPSQAAQARSGRVCEPYAPVTQLETRRQQV